MNEINSNSLIKSINKFDAWLEKHGYESYDPYDIWGIPYSLWARKIYYKKGIFGVPFILPVILIDIIAPWIRSLLVKKERFATADAQLLLAYINLFKCCNKETYLNKAKQLGEEIVSYSISGYSGYCWGYPFNWQNSGALWPKNTPYITATPYCFEGYLALFDSTGEKRYLDIAESISRFVSEDLNETPSGPDAAAGSYSPIDNGKVINASAYRAMVLVEAAKRFNNERYLKKGLNNIHFILQSQNDDGSWPYDIVEGKKSFIDHFHTCFVIKNLVKCNHHLDDSRIFEAIKKGFAWYRSSLFRTDGMPKSFAIQPRFQIVTDDLYNFAEAITLCSLISDHIPGAIDIATTLADKLTTCYQVKKGHFITKQYLGGIQTTFPFLRWSQSQVFYGLTNLLIKIGCVK